MAERGDPVAPRGARFPGTRIIVTGGARGIGAEIVRRFALEGGRLAVLDRLGDELRELTTEIGSERSHAVVTDLEDPDATIAATARAVELLGGVDVVVNNAGVFRSTPLLDITADEWDHVFAVNTRPMLLTTQVAARAMIAAGDGGRIVNMASMGGKVGASGQAHYAASKAAVISLTQVAAAELGAHQINVNAVCPGYVLTEMGAGTRTPEMVAEWSQRSPLGRLAEPADVANMVLFLASDDAAYCTGQALNVTGGMIMH